MNRKTFVPFLRFKSIVEFSPVVLSLALPRKHHQMLRYKEQLHASTVISQEATEIIMKQMLNVKDCRSKIGEEDIP